MRPKKTRSFHINTVLSKFPNAGLVKSQNTVGADQLWCTLCSYEIEFLDKRGTTRLYAVQRHIDSGKHKSKMATLDQTPPTTSAAAAILPPEPPKSNKTLAQSEFDSELVEAFRSAGIPLGKLKKPKLKAFLAKWCRMKVKSVCYLSQLQTEEAGVNPAPKRKSKPAVNGDGHIKVKPEEPILLLELVSYKPPTS